MANFSGAVKIGDLNDFIAPSQACVVSLQGGPQQPAKPAAAQPPPPPPEGGLQLQAGRPAGARARRGAAVKLDAGGDEPSVLQQQQQPQQQQQHDAAASAAAPPPAATGGGFQQTVLTGERQAVKVSLNDCLACSGCVTSAETVLLQAQSLQEFLARCADADAHVVVSVSPQSRAALAAAHGLSPQQVQERLAAFLKHRLAVAAVLDIGLGHALALNEAAAEFLARYRRRQQAQAQNGSAADGAPGPLPMLASACPGWVCYAEKTQAAALLPHIASTRSPQAVMGALVKRVYAAAAGLDPRAVYHVTVMPCYDKKLEASRDDFNVPGTTVPEVDSCLTTGELQELLERHGAGDLAAQPAGRADDALRLLLPPAPGAPRLPEPALHADPGSSSGGYADHIFAVAARQLFGVDVAAALRGAAGEAAGDAGGGAAPRLPFRALRNADLQELSLLGPDGAPLLRFARAYGFRNIQAVVRGLRGGGRGGGGGGYDYVEVMACPSGCLNGGGQLKPPPGESPAQLVARLEAAFFQQEAAAQAAAAAGAGGGLVDQQQAACCTVAPGVIQLTQPPLLQQQQQQQQPADRPSDQGAAAALAALAPLPASIAPASLAAVYDRLARGPPGSRAAGALLHTAYHKREKTVTSALADW